MSAAPSGGFWQHMMRQTPNIASAALKDQSAGQAAMQGMSGAAMPRPAAPRQPMTQQPNYTTNMKPNFIPPPSTNMGMPGGMNPNMGQISAPPMTRPMGGGYDGSGIMGGRLGGLMGGNTGVTGGGLSRYFRGFGG